MSRFSADNNNFPYDNNVLVLDMVLGALWGVAPPVSWDHVAKLVPGFSPKECALRFEELKASGAFPVLDNECNAVTDVSSSCPEGPEGGATEESRGPRLTGNTLKTNPGSFFKANLFLKLDRSPPFMLIHVCDEAKDLRQDFSCPRELLVKEMRYFSEYLSVDAQRWDEVDISVHCDVQIFDWLMNYVRRNSAGDGARDKPRLEPSNVISILISSDFLKMDTLVEECISFCHRHMSAIVATPCNMNCINSALAARIALQFSHNEADDIRDKKDKFKSKLFQKKIESLFQPQQQNKDSPGNASTLYRCGLCLKLLTKDTERKISCVPGKINVNQRGDIIYTHTRQKSWDVHEFLSDLFEELKSWVLVYWRLWGTINHLSCSRCQQVFVVSELTQCRYHPDSVRYGGSGEKGRHGAGVYPCCAQRVLRFDASAMPKGCRMRDHIVSLSEGDEAQTKVLNDLLLHRDAVCVSNNALQDRYEYYYPYRSEAFHPLFVQKHQSLLSEDEECTTGSEVTEDEVGDEEELNKKQAVKKPKKTGRPLKKQLSSPNFSRREKSERVRRVSHQFFQVSVLKNKWDSSRSLRYNQDAQREEGETHSSDLFIYEH
uniref:Si:ch211-189k9.2 n=1 Tax=Neogobius melanostomus TaxID=47308 RepID=A0A8C6WJM2_9GOBI